MIKKISVILNVLIVVIFSAQAQTNFGKQNIIVNSEANRAASIHSADLNGDGYMDLLFGCADDKVAWYKNIDGKGTFSTQQVITKDAKWATSVYTADLDGDGDLDVLSASYWDNKIAWYENTDRKGTFGSQKVITKLADEAQSVYSADIDNDGDMDVLSASYTDNIIAWYENIDGNGTFSSQHVITRSAINARSVFSIDIDGDGDMDVLSASQEDKKIAWYENTDGKGTFGSQKVITTDAGGAQSVFSTDLDGDGDNDILSASYWDNKIAWYENIDGKGTFSAQNIISENASEAECVYSADLDGDGDMDVISASVQDNKIAWYENTDGKGTFRTENVISKNADRVGSVYAADLDSDGDMDVLSASWDDDKIAWYENTDGKGTFGIQHIIAMASVDVVTSVYSADIDNDGDLDILSASRDDNKIAWYENTDGKGTFGSQQVITTNAYGATSVYAIDIDRDGDIDVLSAGENSKIAWYENTDGKGTFGSQLVISTAANWATSVYSADLDSDGDMDVLSASEHDNKIAWYENIDGKGAFGTQQVITLAAGDAKKVYSADLDGDGDMDVLSASTEDDKIAWYENTDGKGTFSNQKVITIATNGARAVYAADLDGDGDIDVLSASNWDDKIAWYENTDGKGTFSTQKVISIDADGPSSVYSADLDGDGDIDVLSASSDNKIAWYENTNGKGVFGPQQIITILASDSWFVLSADLDGDGDLDVISAPHNKNRIVWIENLLH